MPTDARPAVVGLIRHPVHLGPSHCRDELALKKQVRRKVLFWPSDERDSFYHGR